MVSGGLLWDGIPVPSVYMCYSGNGVALGNNILLEWVCLGEACQLNIYIRVRETEL